MLYKVVPTFGFVNEIPSVSPFVIKAQVKYLHVAQKNTKWFLNIRYTIPSSVANQLKALIVWAIIL